MRIKHLALIVLFSCLAQAAKLPNTVAQSSLMVDVEAYGAVADGITDNTGAVQSAITALVTGQTLYFPCTSGYTYLVLSPINFGRLNNMHVAGSGPGCTLTYGGPTSQPYAFSFVGAEGVDITEMDFASSNASAPPQTVLLLGRTNSNVSSGHFNFNSLTVGGYATKALVYSIASEENSWLEPNLDLNGGGALYVFYTSGSDDLSVANLPSSSNLSLWMQNFHVKDYSSGITPAHVLIYDNGNASGSGSHTYRDGYLASGNGTAFAFYSNGSGTIAWMNLLVDSNRFEDGYQMFLFGGQGSFGDIVLTNNKTDGVTNYLIDLPTTCFDCTFQGNVVAQGNPTVSQFGTLQNSTLSEAYPFTVQHIASAAIFNRTTGTLQLASGLTTVACSSANEGTMGYVPGSGSQNGRFLICQRVSGNYTWTVH